MKRLVLVRHGLTEGNVRRWYYGALDLPLCGAGVRALQEAAAAGLYPPVGAARVITSGLLRTEQTLALLCGPIAHERWPALREVAFGVFEGHSYDELKERADYQRWLTGDWFTNVPPGGESFAAAETRILTALEQLLAQPQDVWAVVHGGTILSIMQALFPQQQRNAYAWQPAPGGGYSIDLAAHTYCPIGIQPSQNNT